MQIFVCASFACVQMQLGGAGAGNIIFQSVNLLIYSTYRTEYTCNVIDNMYACTSRSLVKR